MTWKRSLPIAASRLVLGLATLLVSRSVVRAQSSPTEHVFQATQADVNKALRELKAMSTGRLPVLDGFVVPDVPMLDKYRRAYYQYRVETHAKGTGTTLVRVSARVTAWYAGTDKAGYRELPSNGRLETDLIERLDEALQQNAKSVVGASTQGSAGGSAQEPTDRNVPPAQTADKSVVPSPAFRTPLGVQAEASRSSLAAPSAEELARERRVRQLNEQAMNLEEVLRNQSHPDDLAAVRKTGTPVYAKADDSAEVLLRSDAEDEFKVLEESGDWVHVQISGISRGWIRRAALEMPAEMRGKAGPDASSNAGKTEPREETSLFPGDWTPLRGRMVRITWVEPDTAGAQGDRWQTARSMFRDAYSRTLRSATKVEGVVIVIDSADGGIIAATMNTLQQWNSGAISDAAFRKECWADPPEALGETAKHEDGTKSTNP